LELQQRPGEILLGNLIGSIGLNRGWSFIGVGNLVGTFPPIGQFGTEISFLLLGFPQKTVFQQGVVGPQEKGFSKGFGGIRGARCFTPYNI